MIIILAHPFRIEGVLSNLDKKLLKSFTAVELNARDLYQRGRTKCQREVEQLAQELSVPIVAGSDTHQLFQSGSIKNIFKHNCKTIKELKQEIELGDFKKELSNELELRVRVARYIKKMLIGYNY